MRKSLQRLHDVTSISVIYITWLHANFFIVFQSGDVPAIVLFARRHGWVCQYMSLV